MVAFDVPNEILDAGLLFGVTLVLGFWLLSQFNVLVPVKREYSMASLARSVIPQEFPTLRRKAPYSVNGREIEAEFVFEHSRLPADISENRLAAFLREGFHRQIRATYNNGLNKRFNSTQAWSRIHFTSRLKGIKRFRPEEYTSCITIMTATKVWDIQPKKGHPGLVHQGALSDGHLLQLQKVLIEWKRLFRL